MKKKMVALLLVFAMAATVSGCGNTATKETSKETSKATEDVQEKEEESQKEDVSAEADEDPAFSAYADTVTITTVGTEASTTKYINEGDDLTNNVWTRWYKDALNIEVKYDWISDEYDTKLNLSIANNTLPDVFKVSGTQLQELIEADLLWDLSEIFEQYASEGMKKLKSENEDTYKTAMVDDALYGIPMMSAGEISQIRYIWIRNDWKEALKLDDPKTMDDIVNICLAFMEKYESLGLCVDSNLNTLYTIAPAWQAYPGKWVTGEDGSIVYGSVQEEMKNALSVWAQWYEQGIINADFSVTNQEIQTQQSVSGKLGVQPWWCWWGSSPGINVVKNLGNDSLFYPYEIPTATGEEVLAPITFNNSQYVVVSKTCENPEAAIKLLNHYYYYYTETFFEGVDPDITKQILEGEGMQHACPFIIHDVKGDYNSQVRLANALETGDTSELDANGLLHYEQIHAWIDNKDISGVNVYLQRGYEESAYGKGKKILDEGRVLKNRMWGLAPEEVLKYGSTLDTLLLEGFTKIIMGEESIDYFDVLVENWAEAGGDIATKAINEKFGE